MKATIADIRRGDRFTRLAGRGGTYIAVRAAKVTASGKARVWVVEDHSQTVDDDGVMDLADRGRMIDPGSDTPVEIHDRALPIRHTADEPEFTDEPNVHLGGKTDRELRAAELRRRIPELIGKISDLGSERDLLVRQGITAGIPVIELADMTGLSRARIYQIRDGRR
ncbi:hypothetical protein [Streptomyces scabiei]|uniref:Uncharacterized protein n=1 Tax=Streptomyces scabiei TaxID=1930 RepID=A0A100JR16_STRSC|nr:hypothetical protein [Streptomyces scabiei]GAQ64036.1 hypothetical protein SsS58_04425 [Streptomyces scabiei]